MSIEQTVITQPVEGFNGEHRQAPESQLPMNVSPDAQDIDYVDGFMRKRAGFIREHGLPERSGALHGGENGTPAGFSLTGSPEPDFETNGFRVEFMFQVLEFHSSGFIKIINFSDGPRGFYIDLNATPGNNLRINAEDNLGVLQQQTHPTALVAGTTYAITLSYAATDKIMRLFVNDTEQTLSLSAAGGLDPPDPGDPHSISVTGITELKFIVDDFRLYVASSTSGVSASMTLREEVRELTDLELTTAISEGLIAYFKINEITSEIGFKSDNAASSGDDLTLGNPRGTMGLLDGEEGVLRCYGLQPLTLNAETTKLLAFFSFHARFFTDASGWGFLNTYNLGAVSESPWGTVQFQGRIISCHKNTGNFKYDGTNFYQLTPDQPSPIGVGTAAAEGAAGNIPNGTYNYRFVFRNSGDASVGLQSTDSVAVTVTGGPSEIDLSDIPTTLDPQVDKVDIYRTKVGGAIYFFLAEISEGTLTYNDDATDNTLVSIIDPFVGQPAASSICLKHHERLWLLNQSGTESRALYSEVTTALKSNGWTSFYTTAAGTVVSKIEAGEGDGDEITGAISSNDVIVVFKRRSIWVISGADPRSYGAHQLFPGHGCVAHATVAASARGIYYLGQSGVFRIPLPLGSGPPEDITSNTQRSIFTDISEATQELSVGIFDTLRQEYRVSLTTVTDGLIEMVFSERTGAWSKRTTGFDAYTMTAIDSGKEQLYAMRKGYLVNLSSEDTNDGGQVSGASTIVLTGTVDSADAHSITDTSQSWPTSTESLAGIILTVISAAGVEQKRTIMHNTATKLYVETAFSPTPSAADTFFIAGIEAEWKSPHASVGERGKEHQTSNFLVWQEEQDESKDVDYTLTADDDETNRQLSGTLDTTARFTRIRSRVHGEELQVAFSNHKPDEPFAVEAFQVGIEEDTDLP